MQRQIKCGLNSLKNRSLRTLFRTLLDLLESVFPTSYYVHRDENLLYSGWASALVRAGPVWYARTGERRTGNT